jgi:hypothetical protein
MVKPITPWEMTVIINIQAMNKYLDPKYDGFASFKRLRKLNLEELHKEQELLISKYNELARAKFNEIIERQNEQKKRSFEND